MARTVPCVRIEDFKDRFGAAAEAYGVTVEQLRQRDAYVAGRRWLAFVDGTIAGAVTARDRPDRRIFLDFGCPNPDSYGPLAEALAREEGLILYASSNSREPEKHQHLLAAGFETEITSEVFSVPFQPVLDRLRSVQRPRGYRFLPPTDVDLRSLLELDNCLRQDVPGTDGWQGDADRLRAEMQESPPFDPAGYLVALDNKSRLIGLARVWRNSNGPRFGMVGTLPTHRRTMVGPYLIRSVLTAASTWGSDHFTTETSISNRHIHPRLESVGARSDGFIYQLRRDP